MGVRADTRELGDFLDRVHALTGPRQQAFWDKALHEGANWLISAAVPRTPVGKRHGGTLRRGWTAQAQISTSDAQNMQRGIHSVTVTNPVSYASYVENGHRQTVGRYVPAIGKRLTRGWVEGQHFLRAAEDDVKSVMPDLLEETLDEYLKEAFNP